MCLYVIQGSGLSLPVDDTLGEGRVIERALNLAKDFPSVRVMKHVGNNKFVIWDVFDDMLKKHKIQTQKRIGFIAKKRSLN